MALIAKSIKDVRSGVVYITNRPSIQLPMGAYSSAEMSQLADGDSPDFAVIGLTNIAATHAHGHTLVMLFTSQELCWKDWISAS
ncbi:hypothetical protein ANCCAN_03775 [Ancylostoma caninum]|uniref:Uncharacterized protein n=1 Tax=Ancylostoma caninum TaxID=29170 RepID=A0A368H4G6_ANCCA|nr:hypothetical protein ANCCAN_03775 [Ancylostoma caninum]